MFRAIAVGLALSMLATSAGVPAADKPDAENPLAVYLARDYVFVDAPALESYLDSIVKRLLDARGSKLAPPRVLIFSSEALDAFSDTEGNLFVSTGTLREMSNEDELAALLGHELAHLQLRHPQQKDTLRAFPVGVETLESVAATARAIKGKSTTRPAPADSPASLSNTYAANLVWSDILAPGWNRKQERAADEGGFEMMRRAGYDPSAFGTLFPKLAAASAKRSERLEKLKQVMLARAKATAKKATAKPTTRANTSAKKATQSATSKLPQDVGNQLGTAANKASASAGKVAEDMRDNLTEGAVESLVDGLASFNRDYDAPDERQAALAAYAEDNRLKTRPPPAASRYRQTLKQGQGASLLKLDAAGIRLLGALERNDTPGSQAASKELLPAAPNGTAGVAHLNLAAGAWYQAQRKTDVAEQHAGAWLKAKHPPARAYLWKAWYQSQRKEYAAGIATLDRGRATVGEPAPFLPPLVALNKAAGRRTQAEELTMECAAQDKRNAGMRIASMFRGERVPSGLYAECVKRLGYEPKAAKEQNAVIETIKHPGELGKDVGKFGKDVGNKVKDIFNR